MRKIKKLQKELDFLIEEKSEYNKILKKSQELDKYITKEMIKINFKHNISNQNI